MCVISVILSPSVFHFLLGLFTSLSPSLPTFCLSLFLSVILFSRSVFFSDFLSFLSLSHPQPVLKKQNKDIFGNEENIGIKILRWPHLDRNYTAIWTSVHITACLTTRSKKTDSRQQTLSPEPPFLEGELVITSSRGLQWIDHAWGQQIACTSVSMGNSDLERTPLFARISNRIFESSVLL